MWAYILVVMIGLLGVIFLYLTTVSIISIYGLRNRFGSILHTGFTLLSKESIVLKGILRSIEDPLVSPLTGDECAGYEGSVEEYLPRSKIGTTHWKGSDSVPFLISTQLGDITIDNVGYPEPSTGEGISVTLDFPGISFYKTDLRKLPENVQSNLKKVIPDIHTRTNSVYDSAFMIHHNAIPHNREVFILAEFSMGEGMKIVSKPCKAMNSIVISDSMEGIKRAMKNSILINIGLATLSILSPIAIGHVILL